MEFKKYFLAGVALPSLLLAVSSCSEEEPVPGPDSSFTRLGQYDYVLRSSQKELTVSLEGIKGEVARIESPIQWLAIAADGTTDDGFCRLSLKRLAETPKSFTADSAHVYFADNRFVTLVINAEGTLTPLADNGASDYEAFNKEWWNQQQILFSTTRTFNGELQVTSEHISLPWAPATTVNFPSSMFTRDAMTTNEGWVMAYNLFAAETDGCPNSKPYFMLYNRYTGILRVFYYQATNAGTGGEFSFVVTPDDATSSKFPFYHSMQYAVPVCNSSVQTKGNFLHVTPDNNSFQQIVTPFLRSDITLKPGWYCFDIDMSCYKPGQSTPFLASDRLAIDCLTADKANITLAGTIDADMSGDIQGLANSSTSTSNGLNYLDQFKSGTDNATDAFSQLMEGNYLKAAFKGVMSLWNFGKALTGNATDDYTSETKSTGTINMSFTGKISLDGYSTSNTSNNATGVEFSYNAFSLCKDTGLGVWSLQDNPVVYVVNDRIMGEDEDLACVVESDCYSVGSSDPAENNLRLMTFFDPTTIKFNINTSLYDNIRNAKMTWVYGVYPNQPKGHTDAYRNGLLDFASSGALASPAFIDKKNVGKVYKSFSSDFANMEYLEHPLEDTRLSYLDDASKAKIYAQADADYRYYGMPGNSRAETDLDFFVLDPVVLLPTTFTTENDDDDYGRGVFRDFEAPDFVVGVTLTFEYDLPNGKTAKAVFTKRFLPQVKAISTKDMLSRRQALQTYANNGVHQTVNGLTIKHEGAKTLLRQFFDTADFIKNYDE